MRGISVLALGLAVALAVACSDDGDLFGGSGFNVGGSASTSSSTTNTSTTSSSTSTGVINGDKPCGDDTCKTNEVCCLDPKDFQKGVCKLGKACGPGSVPVTCNNHLDCFANEVCCGQYNEEQKVFKKIECISYCTGFGDEEGVIMCYQDSGSCGFDTCVDAENLPAGYSICE